MSSERSILRKRTGERSRNRASILGQNFCSRENLYHFFLFVCHCFFLDLPVILSQLPSSELPRFCSILFLIQWDLFHSKNPMIFRWESVSRLPDLQKGKYFWNKSRFEHPCWAVGNADWAALIECLPGEEFVFDVLVSFS